MTYKPRNGDARVYVASIHEDGSLSVNDKIFSSPATPRSTASKMRGATAPR